MRYEQIRPVSFRIALNVPELTLAHREMRFPEEWKSPLLELQVEATGRPASKTSIPISDLNKALRALVPDLLAVDRYATRAGERRWLVSTTEINPEALRLVILAWARASFGSVKSGRLDPVLRQLTSDMLIWRNEQIELTGWDTHPNGTACPAHDAQFRLLPDYIASRLCEPNTRFELKHQVLHFRRVPVAPSRQGAELISWPPLEHELRGKSHYYSYLITISVQTIPFVSYPVIYVDFGIRRWVSQQTRPGKNQTSVYLHTSVPWLPELHHSSSFQVASTKWTKSDGQFVMTWSSHLPEVLEALNPQQPFPDPRDLFENPFAGLNLNGGPNAAIVYKEGMVPRHPSKPGLMPADRFDLAQQVAAALEPEFVFTEMMPRVSYSRQFSTRNPFTEEPTDNGLAERRISVSRAIGEQVTFEVHYQREETARTFVEHICDVFEISSVPTFFPFQFRADGIAFTVNCRQLGKLGDALHLDPGIKNKRDQQQRSVEERIALIRQELFGAEEPTIAFVELAGKDHFNGNDPKQTIRTGFAHTGRLTQFIDLKSDVPLEQRIKQAVLDGLRQWGLLPAIASTVDDATSTNYAGLWLIQKRPGVSWSRDWEYLPVFVFVDSADGSVLALFPGLDKWLPYPEALLALGQGIGKGFKYPNQALNYIQQTIQSEIVPSGHTLLLCHAQNLRRTWTWLQDKCMKPDLLQFGDSGEIPIQDWPGLRIVRVRSNAQSETPQWYATQNDRIGLSKGLFQISERVFASTYGKPVQFKMVSTKVSKVERPSAVAWNPSIYEMTVAAMQPGDNPAQLATVAHELRDISIQYEDATALSLPLHLASLMQEYVQLTASEDDLESDEE